jgi:hypothetical protein
LSGERPIPGTVLPGEKAACSICAKKFSGLRVEYHGADLVQRVIAMRPDLGQVEGVEAVRLGIGIRHDLYRQRPAWIVAAGNRFEQIAPMIVE